MQLYAKKKKEVAAIVMDFSKAFDMLNHNLLLYKLKTYVFDTNALTLVESRFSSKHKY